MSNGKRNDGPCPIMRSCGGCAWLGVPYLKQLRRKQRIVEGLFSPLAERPGADIEIEPVHGMGGDADSPVRLASPRSFRHKAATPFAPGAEGSLRSGFFCRGTHEIIPVATCAVEAPGARRILNAVAGAARRCRIPAYDEDRRQGVLRHAVLRLGWRSDEGILTIVTSTRELSGERALKDELRAIDPSLTTIARNVNPRVTNAILGAETRVIAGPGRMRDRLLDCVFEISPTSFYQTNPAQTETLYRTAIKEMALEDGEVVLDAYCGSGTIGLSAASAARARGRAVRVIGVERLRAGVKDAERNATLNGLGARATFIAQDATAYLRSAAERGERVDALVLDPPRAGSTPAFLEAAVALAPRRIVYISCNPVTQVRDLEALIEGGYRAVRVTPVDMFPHTEHVETVAALRRI